MSRLLAVVSVAAIAALGLAACGDDDETGTTAAETTATDTTATSGGGGGETVSFEADPSGQLAYTQTDVTAKPGNATIEFDNPSSTGHDVVIEDESGNEIAKTDARAKQVKAEQLIDRRFLEEMEKDGTFARLGLPR